jgi:hypothetical protein
MPNSANLPLPNTVKPPSPQPGSISGEPIAILEAAAAAGGGLREATLPQRPGATIAAGAAVVDPPK